MKHYILEFTMIYMIFIWFINLLFTYTPEIKTVEHLSSLFLSVGGAFISATAIIFSIIIFTLQTNNERLPYGMFKKMSRDTKLLSSFLLAEFFSVLITICSLISVPSTIFYVIQISITLVLLILCCFIYSYRRALKLINPIYQLTSIVEGTKKDLFSWIKAFNKTNSNEDYMAKYNYLKQHPYWINSSVQGIIYCNSYARRLIEQNDYETSEKALQSIIDINTNYIEAKGHTFIRRKAFSDAMASNDKFIEDTLEEIRQNIQNSLSTNDERFIISNFKVLKELHYIYSNIDYMNRNGDRFASSLASQYLIDGVASSLSHNIPNVLLNGIRLLSHVSQKEILDCESKTIDTKIKLITHLACMGIIDKELLSITKCSLEELSGITVQLLLSKEQDTNYINEEMNKHLFLIGKTEITSPSPSYHYFKNIYYNKVSAELIDSTNSLTNKELTGIEKINIIKNVEKWSDSIRHDNRELFKLALEHNSNLAPQLIDFISNVSKCLMSLASLEIVEGSLSSKLKNNALWLIFIFTFIKNNKNVIDLLERNRFTDTLFELMIFAYEHKFLDITIEIRDILLSYGFKGQKVNDQYRVLSKAIGASIYINIQLNKSSNNLISVIKKELHKYDFKDDGKSTIVNGLENMFNIYSSINSSIETSLNSLSDREELKNYIDSISELILNDSEKKL